MKYAATLLYAGLILRAQSIPIAIGPNPTLSPPAVDRTGVTALVSSSVSPDGTVNGASDLYLLRTDGTPPRRLTNLANNGASWIDLSTDGSKAAYNVTASTPPGTEEIHIVDTGSGADKKVAVDTAGCIQPLNAALCFGCFFSCVRSVHLSPDASKIVYSASETQPVYVVNADGSGVVHLPIQGAVLAPSPQRVVSRNGQVVFTVPGQMVEDVYVVNMDGSGMQNLTKFPAGVYALNATISEDGGTVAFQLQPAAAKGQTTNYQIYIAHQDGSPARQLTNDPLDASSPSLSADGSLVAFMEGGQALLQRTDGSTPAVHLTYLAFLTGNSVTLSGDGATAVVSVGSALYTVRTGMKPQRLFGPRTLLPNGISSYTGLMPASPGSLIRISGWNLQDDAVVFGEGAPLPLTLGGVAVKVNGQLIPMAVVTPLEIIAQLPFTTPAGMAKVAVDFDDELEAIASTTVKDTAPEVLQYALAWFSSNYAMAFHAGTATAADQTNPAAAGEVLEMYGVGLGTVSPAVEAGVAAPSDPPARAIAIPQVRIGDQKAAVLFAGLAPGQVGIYQMNVVVPSGLKSGSQPVFWSSDGPGWVIWVK